MLRRYWTIAGVIVAAAMWAAQAMAAAAVLEPQPAKPDTLVGCYYFPGWCEESRWYCLAANDKVQHPLMGYYREGDPEVADWQIKWALEHGISFFAFDYYTLDGSQLLETALDDGFLKSKYISRFKFCLNWCNHAPAERMTAEELRRFGDLAIRKYMGNPSYLRIGGRPVVMVLAGASFVRNLGQEGAKAEFDTFRSRCKSAGLGDPYIVFCEGGTAGASDIENSLKSGADAFCLYNYPYAGTPFTGPGQHGEATYADLIKQGEGLWNHWSGLTGGAFWPTVMPGWDRRPWLKEADLIRTGSTPDLFEQSLRSAKSKVNKDRVVMIEAWNEWGEGSTVEPSVERGFQYLDRVRKVFCPTTRAHVDITPKTMKTTAPVFDLRLPVRTSWRFDFDPVDWTSSGVEGLRLETGALIGKAATGDPQICSPMTYIRCADYPRVRIMMRIDPPAGGSGSTTAQLYWSTNLAPHSEATSLTFTAPMDSEWHVYELNLASRPSWQDRTDIIRFDPADTQGATFRIDEIRFLKKASGR